MNELGLGTKLRRLLASLDGDVQAVYDELGVAFRPRFYPVVQQLLRHGPQGVGALADATGVSQPAMTQTLGQMRKLSLIASSAGPDPRQRIVHLTDGGEQLAARLQPVWHATAAAAADLETETRIEEAIEAALAALAQQPFKERLREMMQC